MNENKELFNMLNRKNLTWFYPKICKFQDNQNFVKQLDGLNDCNDNNSPLLLYIHIPFCASFCSYCACFKENFYAYSFEDREKFTECIVNEIEFYFSKRFIKDAPVSYILFGGGSPSILDMPLLEKIFDSIYANCNVENLKGISFEGNVMSLNDFDKLSMLKEKGVNRVSFGLQTMNEDIRKKLNIKAPIDDIYACSELIKKVGIKDNNIDIIYNLPDQTTRILENDLNIVTKELKPTIIQTYRFNLFANTHLDSQIKEHYFKASPSKENEMYMFQFIDQYLRNSGYHNQLFINMYSNMEGQVNTGIEISMGNNKLYGSKMLGIGPGAMSYLSGYNYRNVCSVKEYITKVESQGTAIQIGHCVSRDELEHRVMVMFPNFMHIKLSDIPNSMDIMKNVDSIIKYGYAQKLDDELILTNKGKLWAGDISSLFFSESEKIRVQKSYINSLRHKKNPFNQDSMNV